MRKLLFVLLAVFMLSFGSLISAQDMNMCGSLSEGDCALLMESSEAMAALDSASFAMDMNLALTGAGSDDMALSLAASGAYNLGGLSMDDFATMDPNDIEGMLSALTQALGAISANLDLTITLPPDPTIPFSEITLNLALVNGIGYLNFESLGALLGGPEMLESIGLPTGWGGLDLIDTIDNMTAMMGDLSELEMDDVAGEMSEEDAMAMANAMMQYVMFERVADEGSLAVFTGSVDIGGMMSDPMFQGLMMEQLEAQGMSMDDSDMEEFNTMVAQLSEAMDVNMTQKINVDSKYLENISFDLVLDSTAFGEEGILTMGFSVNFADFDAVAPIAAPEGAPVAAFMDLMMLFGAMGGGF